MLLLKAAADLMLNFFICNLDIAAMRRYKELKKIPKITYNEVK